MRAEAGRRPLRLHRTYNKTHVRAPATYSPTTDYLQTTYIPPTANLRSVDNYGRPTYAPHYISAILRCTAADTRPPNLLITPPPLPVLITYPSNPSSSGLWERYLRSNLLTIIIKPRPPTRSFSILPTTPRTPFYLRFYNRTKPPHSPTHSNNPPPPTLQ